MVELDSQAAAHRLRERVLAWAGGGGAGGGVTEVVVGAQTALVSLADKGVDLDEMAGLLAAWAEGEVPEAVKEGSKALEVPVTYDGPDLAEVASLVGLSVEEVVRRHLAPTYTVGFLGFSPGFAYLTGLDPALVVARRDSPRRRVPAGSVGIAGGYTAAYPQATPGGWRLLASTPLVAFDAGRCPPSPFVPGGRVRFVAAGASAAAPLHWGELAATKAAESPQFDLKGEAASIFVARAGPLTTVQDLGRVGLAHLGVSRAGPVDLPSLIRANRLVGNPDGSAGLESTLLGPELRAETSTVVALAGGAVEAEVDGEPVPMDTAIPLPAGSTLSVGPLRTGVRAYIAVAGGIGVAPVLGSRSADTLTGLGPPPLRDGDRLPVGPAGGESGNADSASRDSPGLGPAGADLGAVGGTGPRVVRVTLGPRNDWFSAEALATFLSAEWTVTPACDRTGTRLAGPTLTRAQPNMELPPEPMVEGAVQVPPDGQPIVLLANHPTTGGYPVIAVVASADLPRVAQARPGDTLAFSRL